MQEISAANLPQPGMQTATCAGIATPARSLASSVRPLFRSVRVFVRFFLHSLVRLFVSLVH